MKRTHRLMKLLSDELFLKHVSMKRLAHDKVIMRMTFLTPIMSRSLSSLYVKSCGMPTNEVNEQNWLFEAFIAIACSSATVDCCYLQALLFRLEEWVLFWLPWMSARNGTVFAHVRMKLSFVSWTHSLFSCLLSRTYWITQGGCVVRLVMCPFAHSCWSHVAVGHSASEEEGMILSMQGAIRCFPEGQRNHSVHEGSE